MKHWIADYTVKYKDGREEEKQTEVESHDITRALATVINDIINPMRMDPEVEWVVVWNIGIVGDDVFRGGKMRSERTELTIEAKTNIDSVRQKVNDLKQKLDEASATIEELASEEISVEFEVKT